MWYFELGNFSFNSYVCYLTRGFIASTRAFNLLTRAFDLPTRAFNLATRAFSLLTRGFKLVTRRFELVIRRFELVTRELELVARGSERATCGFELVNRISELVTRVLLYLFRLIYGGLTDRRCHSKVKFPNSFHIMHPNSHLVIWENILDDLHVIFPFVEQKCFLADKYQDWYANEVIVL